MRIVFLVAALAVSGSAAIAQPVKRQPHTQGHAPAKATPKKVNHARACRQKFGSSYDSRTDRYAVRGAKRVCRL